MAKKKKAASPSAEDIAEVRAGKGSARDRREVAKAGGKKLKRNKRHSKK